MNSYQDWLKSNSASDIGGSAVFEGSESEQKKRAQRVPTEIQLDTQLRSLRVAREQLESTRENLKNAELKKIAAIQAYQEALIKYADDEEDDYPTASEKAEKFSEAEYDYLNADDVIRAAAIEFQNAHHRVVWELKESKRLGYLSGE